MIESSPGPVAMAVVLTLFFALIVGIGAAYTAAAYICQRYWGRAPLTLLWAFASLSFAFLCYWRVCSVGHSSVRMVLYEPQVILPYALVGAAGFGIATALVHRHERKAGSTPLGIRTTLLGGTGPLVAFLIVPLLLAGIDRATCANRLVRLVDGSIGTECQALKERAKP